MEVQSGQPLFRISNDDATNREIGEIDALIRDKIQNVDRLTQEVELSRIEVIKAKSDRHKTESMRQQELTKLATYKAIAQSRLDSARIRVKSLGIQRQTAQKNCDRAADLLELCFINIFLNIKLDRIDKLCVSQPREL
jgi:multidrug resistance efflux pump